MDSVAAATLPLEPAWPGCLARLAGCRTREAGPGATLDPPRGESLLAAVEHGVGVLVATRPSGRESVLAVLGRGDLLAHPGLDAALAAPPPWSPPVHVEARAWTRCRVLTVPWPSRPARPDLAWSVQEAVAWQLGRLYRSLDRRLSLPAPDRVLAALEELAGRHGRPVPGGLAIRLPLTQDLLAAMVGSTRETVNRALSRLRADGRVSTFGRCYVVRDPGAER